MTAAASAGRIPNVLSIAGVDPSGGAGLLADLKTFSALNAYGCCVVTALTAQNTRSVTGVHLPPVDFIALQLETLFADVRIDAAKVGMLGNAGVVRAVVDALSSALSRGASNTLPALVVDPVMIAKSGDRLLADDAIAVLRDGLFPLTTLLTPNLPEAALLLGQSVPEQRKDMFRTAERLRRLLPDSGRDGGRRWVLLKGGHLPGAELLDLLHDGERMIELPGRRVDTRNTHGTGCTYSAAITALLPRADDLPDAVRQAHRYLAGAIAAAGQLNVGSGHGPTHHFHALWH